LRRGIAAVVFVADDADLRRFAVVTGPCVPLPGQSESLCSALAQDGGETPELSASLFTALTGQGSRDALIVVERAGPSTLSMCSDRFVEAMAEASRRSLRLADEDEARGDDELTSFAADQDELSTAWMKAGAWPREVVSTRNRLVRLGWARIAQERGLPLYIWHGPSVPQFTIATGTGPYPGRD
jgi:hypothetical protein